MNWTPIISDTKLMNYVVDDPTCTVLNPPVAAPKQLDPS
jgi:hypothetical protein